MGLAALYGGLVLLLGAELVSLWGSLLFGGLGRLLFGSVLPVGILLLTTIPQNILFRPEGGLGGA